jgi:hypothetical protein
MFKSESLVVGMQEKLQTVVVALEIVEKHFHGISPWRKLEMRTLKMASDPIRYEKSCNDHET